MRLQKISRTIIVIIALSCMMLELSGCSTSVSEKFVRDDLAAVALGKSSEVADTATGISSATGGAFPDNPTTALPESISKEIPADDTFVAPDYVQKSDGTLVEAATGEAVTDATIVGTSDTPPDPLAKTEGASFAPVKVDKVRDALAQQNQSESADKAVERPGPSNSVRQAKYGVQKTALQNFYGAYWGTYAGTAAFFQKDGSLFVQQAKGVIDVSEWQGTIDWPAIQSSGVEGAIIRIGYSNGSWDKAAKRNISECMRLGIPFGIYLYSYAGDAAAAISEAASLVSMLNSVGASATSLGYPIFYDLENWSYGSGSSVKKAPTSPSVNTSIVEAWYSRMNSGGYTNLGVYSYTSLLNSTLNASAIRSRTRWVAEYGPKMNYESFGTNDRGWQYSSSGSVSGISGNVDFNAFGNATAVSTDYNGVSLASLGARITDLPEGDYVLRTAYPNRVLDIDHASTADSASVLLYTPTGSKNQVFHIESVGTGQYKITSASSGKVLDLQHNITANGADIAQFTSSGADNQKWEFYRLLNGRVLIASVSAGTKNKVIDLPHASSDLYTKIQLWAASGSENQQFLLDPVPSAIPEGDYTIASGYPNRVLDIDHASLLNSAKALIYTPTGALNQKFHIKAVGNGNYTITSLSSGKVLDLQYYVIDNGADIAQYSPSGDRNQQWRFYKTANGNYMIASTLAYDSNRMMVLDLPHMVSAITTPVQLYAFTGAINQQFTFKKL